MRLFRYFFEMQLALANIKLNPIGDIFKEDFMEMKTTKHNFFSRGIAVLLSVLMCFGAFSMTAFATEDTSADTPQQQLENLLDKIYALNADDYTADSYNELKEQADSVNRPVTPYDEVTGDGMPDWVAKIKKKISQL